MWHVTHQPVCGGPEVACHGILLHRADVPEDIVDLLGAAVVDGAQAGVDGTQCLADLLVHVGCSKYMPPVGVSSAIVHPRSCYM